MAFVTRNSSTAGPSGSGAAGRGKQSFLTMYAEQPNEEVTLEDFEISAFDRLKVLRGIENARSRGMKQTELLKEAYSLSKKHIGESLANYDTWRKDLLSHHILRLAYCNTEEKRKWFVQYETLLFNARLRRESPEEITSFMKRHNLELIAVDDDDKRRLWDSLKQVWEAVGGADASLDEDRREDGEKDTFDTAQFFKVPFLQAMDLVKTRKVLLERGFAYVPRGRITAIICNRFSTYLRMMLVSANRYLPAVLTDERLKPMLEHMSTTYDGPEFGAKKLSDKITANDVDNLAVNAMPLCMQNLHEGLKANGHLKHDGRQQYGLFLKGVGLPLEEALVFWQKSFSKKFTPDQFLKQYAYNVRHNYGKEGNRKDYKPWSCTAIIVNGKPPGTGEFHGCPYKHWDQGQLKTVLARMKLSSDAIDDIVASVRTKDYQIACRKQFEHRFAGADSGSVGNHPNGYAEAAMAFIKAQEAANKTGAGAGAAASPGTAAAGGAAGGPATVAKPPAPGFAATTTPS